MDRYFILEILLIISAYYYLRSLNNSKSKQFIENTLISIKKDLVVLSVKKPDFTEAIRILIDRTEDYLHQIIDMVHETYNETSMNSQHALRLYNYLLEILFEDFDQLRLIEIIESDEEEEIISSFRNQFIQMKREIESELQ